MYGIVGVAGLFLGVYALFLQLQHDGDELGVVDDFTRLTIINRVKEYRDSKRVPQEAPSVSRKNVSVDQMPSPVSKGFRIVKHTVVVDFSNFKKLESIDLAQNSSAVIQVVTHTIQKTAEADTFNATATTSGRDVYIQSTAPMVVFANDDRSKFGKYTVKKRVIEFDVSANPVGSTFLVEHSKTYWNAFQGTDQSWAGYEVRVPTDEIEYLIIFPKNRPFSSIEFFANNADGVRERLERESFVLQGPDNTWLWWRAVNPRVGISYNVDWEW